ncbi:MAG: VOC family protein [Oscillospiraceae bacterium]|nr:VOC family protein [Oscillospiraceae bacterium]
MNFNKAGARILVRKDYGASFDFYTEKMGLVPTWGDRNGPYTSFATEEGGEECMSIFMVSHMVAYKGYILPGDNPSPDTIVCCIPSEDVDADYKRLKDLGVEFIGEPQTIEDWGMRCVYFRDVEGNLFEINGEMK